MITRRQFNKLSKAEQIRALKDSDKYPVECATESSKIDWSLIATLREDMRQDDIDSLMDGREEDYNRIERPY